MTGVLLPSPNSAQVGPGKSITPTGGPATGRAHLEAAIPQVLDGTINPGQVLGRALPLDDIAEAYRLMDDREVLKLLIRP